MGKIQVFNLGALNLKVSPFAQTTGGVLRALNVERDMVGGWKKRPGYVTFLGTPDNSQITSLFSWTRNDGTSLYVYRASGSTLYHSIQGTGAWTTSGNGTITNGGHFGYAVLDDVLIGGDGTLASRHSTNGTSFTNTTGAPLSEHWSEYQGRIWATRGTATSGTNTDIFYSTVGTATDWTTDSSSIRIPGAGRNNGLYKTGGNLVTTKDSGLIYAFDGYSLFDQATDMGPSSSYSLGSLGDTKFLLNRKGVWSHSGGVPQIKSNLIERQIYNDAGSAIAGTVFNNAPGGVHKFDYFLGVGTITDDLTQETIPDCVLKYDIQLDEWVDWQFANRPYSFHSFKDVDSVDQFIFGDNGGQAYRLAGTATSDNGLPIEVQLMGFIHGATFEDKKWNWISGMFNPGCKAKIQFAISDTFTPRALNWKDVGDAKDGVVDYRFPAGTRGKFLFWKIYESSTTTPFSFFGWEFDAEVINH